MSALDSTPVSPPPSRSRAFLAQLRGHDPEREGVFDRAERTAAILAAATDDEEMIASAVLVPLLEAGVLTEETAPAHFDAEAVRMARELVRLDSLTAPRPWTSSGALSSQQAESLRKMLLAMASDPRLVLVRLAVQLQRLRDAKDAAVDERDRLARETRDIYAPLANRLGVWQFKWELEDLSFRYLDPENYKRIAGWLAAKRVDRERYIDEVKATIRGELDKADIHADVAGRPKHIYSIWRKMQRKNLSFDQLYDIRAVRILVDNVAECYAALGIVHSLWPYIPGEFDDYIATPKENLYRSLHTAVIGPGKLPLEIQIRTREMHEHAELGVAAHWTYKEGGRKPDTAYQQKINWLRQILEPTDRDNPESEADFLERLRAEIFEDRVYALSPRGEVVDLPRGATPLDFAYHVHTDLGHRCRGAKVNGRMVPLNQVLANGDQVEIVTGKQLNPSRDWLVPSLGYLASPRNRSKVRAWFRKQDEAQNRAQGRQILERELQRLAIHSVTLPELITEFDQPNADALYLAIGEGEINVAQITGAILRRARPQELPSPVPRKPAVTQKQTAGLVIDGVGDLLSNFAGCCKPVPPEPIAGYITLGRGVSIHRQDCANMARLQATSPERVLHVEWGDGGERSFAVDVNVRAFDRRGLVRDISGVLADMKINIHAMNTLTDDQDGIADMNLRITVHDLEELGRVLTRIQGLSNVLSVRRKNRG
ncbi:MAG TPA: bifunctional (p)ppGpp synthetase/guanosine-3',5'-bis(diphosphate) 3'-pyrophosphohydrolase [Steroidobacteraceae bacterium]|nr:bifunctional (p)ppGpp synthetase/guanosine-3',5'-bis(diphosphate) 3'-pyrophosphohydrolase [Steroidobacteraceae bacterium]